MKSFCTLIICLCSLFAVAINAQPANDAPCNAIELIINGNLSPEYTNIDATVDAAEIDVSAIFNAASHTVWFTFIAPATEMTINTCEEASFDTELGAYIVEDCGDYSTYTELSTNDDFCPSARSQIELTGLIAGNQYYLAVDGFNTSTGTFRIGTEAAAPPNDLPCNAAVVNMVSGQGPQTPGSNAFATSDPGEDVIYPGNLDGNSGSVWYRFEAPASGQATVSTCGAGNFDTELTVFSATNCGDYTSYTFVEQNDDNCGTTRSQIELSDLDPGLFYYVAVDGFSNSSGNFTLSVTAPAPANDLPCNAIPLLTDGTPEMGTNVDATFSTSTGEGNIGVGSAPGASGTVWYTFAGPPSGAITVSLCDGSATFDTELAVYAAANCADYGTYTLINNNDDVCGLQSSLDLTGLIEGDIYYVMVDGFGGNNGDFTITATASPISSASAFDRNAPTVQIYPNPSNGQFQLSVQQQRAEDLTVTITDVSGRKLFHQQYNNPGTELNERIDLRYLAAGVYMVRVASGNTMKIERLVIN